MMTTLAASQLFCASTMRRHAKSFYLSTRILPRRKREAIEALYAFYRSVDDAVDEGDSSPQTRRAYLSHFRRDVEGLAKARHRSCMPWYPALEAAYRDYAIDLRPLLELIDGCESDLDGVNVQRMADLERYAAAVAGTVGRSVIPILGAADADSLRRAEQLGIAMQYTNVLRDVKADAALGRNYLPLAEFPERERSEVMAAIARHARRGYEHAGVLATRLPNDGSRAALLMASNFYEAILHRVEILGFNPLADRAYVNAAAKFRLAARSVLSAYTGLAIIR